VIIVTTLMRDYLPGQWDNYHPTWVEIWTFIGTIGFFTMLFLLFVRFLPVIAMSEVKGVLPEADAHHDPKKSRRDNVYRPYLAEVDNPNPGTVATDPPAGQPAGA
jgi:molybdopterin-containing oxidoreductase family membrane subunit